MDDLSRTADVVVIGAGAIGCSIAYHLTGSGCRDVVVLERGRIASGSSSRGAGGIRAQFSLEAEVRFSLAGLDFFSHFEETMGRSCGYVQHGYLFLISDEPTLARIGADIAMQNRLGVPTELLDAEAVARLVPDIQLDGVIAGAWGPTDGHARPTEVVTALAERSRDGGARVVEETEVLDFDRAGERVTSVRTTRGPIAARTVVIAAGAQAGPVGRLLGADLPILPRRRHLFVSEAVPGLHHPLTLVTDLASGFYVRSEGEQLIFSAGDVGVVEDPSQPPPFDPTMLDRARQLGARRLPAIADVPIAAGWAGLRPLTPDGHAIIDWLPASANVLCIVGFGGHGFQHAPAAGQAAAELILEGRSRFDLAPFRLSRFA